MLQAQLHDALKASKDVANAVHVVACPQCASVPTAVVVELDLNACFSTAEIESACEARPIASATNKTSSCDTPESDIDMHPANHHSRKGLSTFARIQLRLARKRERDAVALLRNAEAIC